MSPSPSRRCLFFLSPRSPSDAHFTLHTVTHTRGVFFPSASGRSSCSAVFHGSALRPTLHDRYGSHARMCKCKETLRPGGHHRAMSTCTTYKVTAFPLECVFSSDDCYVFSFACLALLRRRKLTRTNRTDRTMRDGQYSTTTGKHLFL